MEEAQLEAREKIKHKNESLKEMEDAVAALTAQVEDLGSERDRISVRLDEEVWRGEDAPGVRERQLRETEDRLAREHLAEMAQMVEEMNGTIISNLIILHVTAKECCPTFFWGSGGEGCTLHLYFKPSPPLSSSSPKGRTGRRATPPRGLRPRSHARTLSTPTGGIRTIGRKCNRRGGGSGRISAKPVCLGDRKL